MTSSPHTVTRRIAILGLCLIAAAGVATYALMATPQGQRSSGVALVGGPFTMVKHTGEPVTEKNFAGKPMLLFFGYTFCPDVCPTELQVMAEALRQLGDKGSDIQPIFVTIDPARDTPAVMAAYVAAFGEQFVGLTGTPEQVKQIAGAYRVFYQKVDNKDAPDTYLMDHSSIIYLMDGESKFLKHFTYSTDAKALAGGLASALGR